MKRQNAFLGAIAVLVVGGIAATLIWNWLLGPSLAASGPLTAVPLNVTPASTPGAEPTPAEAAGGAAPSTAGAPTGLMLLQIRPAESAVRFVLDEELRGQPATVVGSTDQVAGEIAVDPSDLSTARVGVIQVNARTLTTDSDRRDRTIRNQILQTDRYELITFAPTASRGLDGSAALGGTYTFQVEGDLTIRDVTQPVVFDVTVRADSESRISGTATATVLRSDFGLVIPSVPFVANVGEEVRLEMDLVATAS